MSKVKIERNRAGIQALLRSSEVVKCLSDTAHDVQRRCGDGYETDSHMTSGRALASVYTAEIDAIYDNLDNNTLLKAVNK